MKLENLNVLITGGASGIGLAFAEQLIAMGNQVMICGRNHQRLLAARRQLPKLLIHSCDISKPEDIDKLMAAIDKHFSTLHILINNAAIQNALNFCEGKALAETIRQEIEIDLIAPMLLSLKVIPKMLANHSAIINISSTLALAPKQSTPAYCAAKAGLRNFSRSLRYQLNNKHIKVVDIVPALVDTEMTRDNDTLHKITPQRLVSDSLRAIKKGKETVFIEKARLFYFLFRLWPNLAYRLLQNA